VVSPVHAAFIFVARPPGDEAAGGVEHLAAHRCRRVRTQPRHDRRDVVRRRLIEKSVPVFVGDLVSFYAETINVGTTSITVRVIVEVERLGKSERVRVTEAEVIYVAVDEKGIKTPIITTA